MVFVLLSAFNSFFSGIGVAITLFHLGDFSQNNARFYEQISERLNDMVWYLNRLLNCLYTNCVCVCACVSLMFKKILSGVVVCCYVARNVVTQTKW